jgi:hypothetical protein
MAVFNTIFSRTGAKVTAKAAVDTDTIIIPLGFFITDVVVYTYGTTASTTIALSTINSGSAIITSSVVGVTRYIVSAADSLVVGNMLLSDRTLTITKTGTMTTDVTLYLSRY